MRVSCACPRELASDGLIEEIELLGITPIITTQVVRAVYEGPDKGTGEAIVELFSREAGHEVNVQYNQEEQRRAERKLERKYKRAKANARLHGHPFKGER